MPNPKSLSSAVKPILSASQHWVGPVARVVGAGAVLYVGLRLVEETDGVEMMKAMTPALVAGLAR